MNTGMMIDELTRQTKDITVANEARVLAWLNMGYQRVVVDLDFPHLRRETTFSTVAGQRLYIPTAPVSRILTMKIPSLNRYLPKINENKLDRANPDSAVETTYGSPQYWILDQWVGALVQPAAGGIRPYVVSSSASDTTPVVTIEGIVAGEVDREIVTLTGTTAVQAAKTYTEIHSVSKSIKSVGKVTVQNLATSPTIIYCTLSPLGYTKKYWQLAMHPIPDAIYTVYYKFIPWLPELVNRSDQPQMPEDCHELVIKAAVMYAMTFQSNNQALLEAEKRYVEFTRKYREKMNADSDGIPQWEFGNGQGNANSTKVGDYDSYLRSLLWG